MTTCGRAAIAAVAAMSIAACGGGSNLPNGPVVNSPGGSQHPPTKLVDVKVVVTVPRDRRQRVRPNYVSVNTHSLAIQLTSVDGRGVSGVNATVVNTTSHARDCKAVDGATVCTATTQGSPGEDVFAVTTYSATDATGSVLSVGTVQAKIAGGGGNVPISNTLSLTLDGVIATLAVSLSPGGAKRGDSTKAAVTLNAFDASGAHIVGPSDYSTPIVLTIQGDGEDAFDLHAGSHSGSTLTIVKPPSKLTMTYDGDPRASSVTLQATVDGPSIGAHAGFKLHGKEPPPPVGTIYALNLGANDGAGATVTEYHGKATGNAAPTRTLNLSSKLYARSIAVDATGNLYVGYFDTEFGFSPSSGTPDEGNEIAIYAPDASGNTQPTAVLTADKSTKTTLFPLFVTFDAAGDLVTYGATSVDGNGGNDAVLTYVAGSAGAAAPLHGWDFASPNIRYAGPTGLALDAAGNFYVNGALHTSLGPSYGLFVASASDAGNPAAATARTIPWDVTTELTPGVTTNVALDGSGEIFVANSALHGSGSSTSCQGRANVFAAGSSGGVTDVAPLRILTLDGIYTQDPQCDSPRNPLAPFFPSIALYGSALFVADDFNNAIDAFSANAHGTVKPSLRIAGAATGLNAPVALVITSVSGRATARPAYPL